MCHHPASFAYQNHFFSFVFVLHCSMLFHINTVYKKHQTPEPEFCQQGQWSFTLSWTVLSIHLQSHSKKTKTNVMWEDTCQLSSMSLQEMELCTPFFVRFVEDNFSLYLSMTTLALTAQYSFIKSSRWSHGYPSLSACQSITRCTCLCQKFTPSFDMLMFYFKIKSYVFVP